MTRALIALAIALLAVPGFAQDAQRGRLLYETRCLSCHYERIHKRDPSRSVVRSWTALRVEVARRAEQVATRLPIEDLDDIAEYLNRTHYRFEK